jgi:hypothetical protein
LTEFRLSFQSEAQGESRAIFNADEILARRRANQLGLGFEIPSKTASIGPNGPKIENEVEIEMAVNA